MSTQPDREDVVIAKSLEGTPAPHAGARSIWSRLAVDPVVVPLAPLLARMPGVTPNRVTLFAGLLALCSAAAFASGMLRLGGALFILRYAVDCLDGQVARVQGTSSVRGAALDIMIDVVGISLIMASLTWHLTTTGELSVVVALALLASVIVYNWALAYRKALAKSSSVEGDGGAGGHYRSNRPGLKQWSALCARLGMSPIPWAVEAEILGLGLAPLVLPSTWLAPVLGVVLAFYVVAGVVNLRRIWRIAGLADRESSQNVS